MSIQEEVETMIKKLVTGDRRAAARLITWVENETEKHHEVMKQIYPLTGKAMILGITGAGGAGKSTLTGHLITKYRQQGKKVGVLMIDPSSPFSGGAILGDRIRLKSHSTDENVYIRSLASRGHLGGISRATYDVTRIIEALGMDVIIIETLGAGQDEIDVIHLAHTCAVVFTPGMGDDIQAMKAGIMEIADIIVLNKADLENANTSLRHLKTAVNMATTKDNNGRVPEIIPTVCVSDLSGGVKGIDELIEAIQKHQEYLHESKNIDNIKFERSAQELGMIFQEEVQKLVFKGLKGTGKRREYINSLVNRKTDPYSVVKEILSTYLMLKEQP